jgi:hypothetical protein
MRSVLPYRENRTDDQKSLATNEEETENEITVQGSRMKKLERTAKSLAQEKGNASIEGLLRKQLRLYCILNARS